MASSWSIRRHRHLHHPSHLDSLDASAHGSDPGSGVLAEPGRAGDLLGAVRLLRPAPTADERRRTGARVDAQCVEYAGVLRALGKPGLNPVSRPALRRGRRRRPGVPHEKRPCPPIRPAGAVPGRRLDCRCRCRRGGNAGPAAALDCDGMACGDAADRGRGRAGRGPAAPRADLPSLGLRAGGRGALLWVYVQRPGSAWFLRARRIQRRRQAAGPRWPAHPLPRSGVATGSALVDGPADHCQPVHARASPSGLRARAGQHR